MHEVGYRHISRRAPQAGSGRISTGGVGRIVLPVCSVKGVPEVSRTGTAGCQAAGMGFRIERPLARGAAKSFKNSAALKTIDTPGTR